MSLGGKTNIPKSPQKPFGSDAFHASTNEQARPLPYLAGRQRLGATFITDAFNQVANAVSTSSGKGQSTTSGYNYYASFAVAVCHGVVNELHDILLNGDSVYANSTAIKCTSLTSSGTTATFTSKNDHNLTTGDLVIVSGAEQLQYNVPGVPVTVTGAKTFTYSMLEAATSSPATGTITARVKLPPVIRGSENFITVTIPDMGTMRFYWGTETQVADPLLAQQQISLPIYRFGGSSVTGSPVPHPPYRGICYAVFEKLFLGFNQTNVQNVEFVVARYPSADWHEIGQINGEANAIAVIADILQNPRAGLGVDTSRLDTAALIATAEQLEDEGLGFSPMVLRLQDARQVLVTLLEYIDGFPIIAPATGKLSIGLNRPSDDEPVEIIDADLTDRAQINPADWSSVKTETDVKYRNRDYAFDDFSARYRDTGARSITEEPSLNSVDREWVTRPEVAAAIAKSVGRAAALPELSGTLKLRRKSWAFFDSLAPGSRFTLNLTGRDLSGCVFRVTDRTWPDPAKPTFQISFRIDRSYLYAEVES